MQTRHPQGATDWQLYRRLLSYVSNSWFYFLLSLGGYLLYSLGTVLLADLMQFLLDALGNSASAAGGLISGLTYAVIGDTGRSPIELARIAVPLAILVLTVNRALGFFLGSYFITRVARNLVHVVRCQLFDRMLVAPSAYYDSHKRGELLSRLTFNVEQVAGAVTEALNTILRESLIVLGLLSYMLYLNWRLCLVFALVAPLIAAVVRWVGKYFRRYSQRIQSAMGDVTQVSTESISGYREVRLFGAQSAQRQRFAAASDDNRGQSLKLALANALSIPVVQILWAASVALLVWLALSPDVLAGFSAGSLAAFLTAAIQLGKPIRQLSAVQSVIQRGLAAADDIFLHMDQAAEPDTGEVSLGRARGDLDIRDLSFTYPGADTPALDSISLSIKAGQRVALVGRSGSGKSTLVQLLARFYVPDAGEISLDGVPLQQYRLSALRQQLAVVSQDIPLFNDTIYNNIAFGALANRSKEEVLQAAQSAHASEFIARLPAGFHTALGDDGSGLSGGQRQRIAIARAVLKDAPLLILDEATAALDYESEHHVQQALEYVMQARTTIIIAHRLSSVEQADLIVVLDRGRIIATGNHAQLLQEVGLYAQLYHKEFTD